MFAKAFIVAATFLAEQGGAAPAPKVAAVVAPTPAPASLPAPAPVAPAPAPIVDPVKIGTPALPSAPAAVAGPSASALVDKVQSFYQNTARFTAKFRQNYTNKAGFDSAPKDGRIYVKKPGKMRWEYKGKSSPVRASYITDGATAWMIEYDNKQYGREAVTDSMLPVAVTFLSGKGDLAAEFTPAVDNTGKYGAKTDHVLMLTPKKPSAQYKQLFLVVDPSNYRVKQSIIIEGNGNVNHFMFFEPDFAKDVPDTLFFVNEKELEKQGYRRITNPKAKTP